eukprot:CAMPEP_0197498830 /NCGR_PEP_ID=MMETSP1311-20131121/60214_1 /TAXON_ID=464262 /ORGANISM="Genus nov. species nov., Strain RCC856" /LENGTH=65 /DNA_ID=CAMNT_0043044561 /DNA_START=57 /DNA_END=251 /DNA_ORIENTATION=-
MALSRLSTFRTATKKDLFGNPAVKKALVTARARERDTNTRPTMRFAATTIVAIATAFFLALASAS